MLQKQLKKTGAASTLFNDIDNNIADESPPLESNMSQ